MVNKCCVPNCKGNYKTGPKVSQFRFPKDDKLKQQWINCIKREKGFQPTNYTRVCELHFKSNDIVREEVLFDRKKNITYVNKLTRPVLQDGALPSIFIRPDGFKYLPSRDKLRKRLSENLAKRQILLLSEKTEETLLEAIKTESLNTADDYKGCISFSNFKNFKNCIKNNESVFNEDGKWSIQYYEKEVIFMNFELHPVPKIRCSAIVNENVSIRAFNDVTELKKIELINFPVNVRNVIHLDLILGKLFQVCVDNSKN